MQITKMFRTNFLIVMIIISKATASKTDTIAELYKIAVSIKQCLTNKFPAVCLKERALDSLNQTIFLDDPIMIGFIRVEKNDQYNFNKTTDEELPNEIGERSILLNDVLYDKLQEFFKSRTIKLNIDEAIEGRKKGDGGGGGGGKGKGAMMMMAGAAACAGAGMMVGKMGMMAMAAMMLSKISLLLSAILVLKKSKGGGGGGDDSKEKQIKIVYATSGGGGGDYGKGGGGGGGGGWHRSIHRHEPQSITYRAHVPEDANTNVIYEGY